MMGLTRLRFGDVAWRVRADVADEIFDSSGLRLHDWIASGRATVVKQGPHRIVYRVQLANRSIYIKHHRVPNARVMFSQWAQSSKGNREFDRIERAAAAVPTIVPLAVGEERKAGFVFESYLITEGLADVESLDHFVQTTFPALPARRRESVRWRLVDQLAELVARLHEARVLNPDMHSGNVLIRVRADDSVELFLVDLQEVRSTRHANWRRSRNDLMAFGLYFYTMARAVDRARFLRRYLQLRTGLGVDWKVEAASLEAELRRCALKFWRKLDYRCVTNNRRFLYRNIGETHGHAVTELGEVTLLALLRNPDAPFRSPAAVVLKESPSSDVARLPMNVEGCKTPVIFKRFNCPKSLDAVRGTLHHSPALRAWHAGHGLLIRRIPTARPLAVIERVGAALVRESYLVTQWIPNSLSLKDHLSELASLPANGQRRRQLRALIQALATLVRRMHERNISHRDMKTSNFLVTRGDNTDAPEVYMIDLAGVQIWRTLPRDRCLQNLSRILVSLQSSGVFTRSDFLRSLFTYQPGVRRRRQEWKETWRYLNRRASEKIERNRVKERPVA
jgi:tRNA A-37 threonylcarbamoyl transferase component Bud32